MRKARTVVALGLLVAVACGKKPETAQPVAGDSAGAMGGMQMTMEGVQMIPLLRAHLDSLGAMPAAGMAATMAAHQDLASRMMDAMGGDMRGMGMQQDAAWTTLGDSVRQDLAELPSLSGDGLKTRVQAHVARMQRMLTMHEGMMKM